MYAVGHNETMPEREDRTWNVNWKSLTTPPDLLMLLFTQVTPQLEMAIKAGNKILHEGYEVETVSAFLSAAALSGNFFWPIQSRNKELKRAFPDRGRDMRHLVGLRDDQPDSLMKIRNDLAHADEKIERLYFDDPTGSILAWGNGANAPDETRRYLTYDPDTTVLHSLGSEINFRDLTDWFIDLHQRVSRVSMPLFAYSTMHAAARAAEASSN